MPWMVHTCGSTHEFVFRSDVVDGCLDNLQEAVRLDGGGDLMNHYFALLDAAGRSVATLPAPQHGTRVDEDGTISGQTGAMAIWNGPPPVWCWEIVEVRSERAWESVPESEKTVIWSRL